jgi:hypothetical protein
VCGSGVCGASITASMATQPADWSFNASAYWNATTLAGTLTDPTKAIAGTIVYKQPIATDSFEASFDFEISADVTSAADGLAFMLETDGATAVGNTYAGLGVATLHGYGFELDTFNNMTCGDTSANHTGVDLLPSCNTGGAPTSLTTADAPFTMRDGAFHNCTVKLGAGNATIALDGTAVIKDFPLPGFVAGAPYFYGFGGANGGGADTHAIKNVAITFPSPRCL